MVSKEFIQSGNVIYMVRCVPRCDIFEVVECKVHNVTDDYFTAVGSSRTHLFSYNSRDIFAILEDAKEELDQRRSDYYSTHSKTKEEQLDIHATDEFVE